MELRHLKYFVAVAEEENVTRAAARLHVSQPPLSRQIKDLEEELGLTLFERKPQSLALTPDGRLFLSEARAVLERAEQAIKMAASLSGRGRTEINIGYAPSLTIDLLPLALRRFQEAIQGVRVRLHDMSTEEMLAALRSGHLDVALMIRPTRMPKTGGITFHPLRKYAICLAMHPTHPLAKRAKVGLREVATERLIAYSREDYPEYHAWLEKLFRNQKTGPTLSEEHDSSTSLIAAVEAGRGVALVQEGFECLSGPRLVVQPLKPAPPPFVMGVAWREEDRDAVVSAFLDTVE
ncbi:MAG: LysR family transcriptional regulator [Opitutales bacterium]|nr:LysR family transcriptional regulator [Opitutales bacterium]MCH8541894.1 LysR family transcriptional regulator [Opitutales bacterium]